MSSDWPEVGELCVYRAAALPATAPAPAHCHTVCSLLWCWAGGCGVGGGRWLEYGEGGEAKH